MKRVLAALILLTQAPAAVAQTPTTDGAAPVDAARLDAAKLVIDQVWPLGTYARIMHATMDQVISGSMAGMYDMRPEDLVPDAKGDPKTAGKTMRQIIAEGDPAFEERMRITMKVMTDGMTGLMTQVEPQVRVALANAYARRFDVAQLNDLHRFFATPTGSAYARESMMLMAGPDMMKAMQAFVPQMVKAMPAIMAKVQDATKHLPPVKGKGKPQ